MKSLEKICSVCGDPIIRSPKVWKDIPGQADVFCSPECIVDILGYNRDALRDIRPVRTPTKNPVVSEEYSAFSSCLGMSFRSQFEVLVAEYLYDKDIFFVYEKITLALGKGRKHWTPDFYIPRSRTFIEVKGVWALGGRKKYLEAVETIEEPIILIPYWMKELFR